MSPKKLRQSRLSLDFVKAPSLSFKKKHARLSGVRRPTKITTPKYLRKRRQLQEQENKKIELGSTKWREFLEANNINPDEKGWDCVGLYNVYGTPTAWSKNMVVNGNMEDDESDSEDDLYPNI